jgi:SAM-dependent methyltransferase
MAMTALDAPGPNADQIACWNDAVGPAWISMQDELDHQLRGLGLAAMAALAPAEGERLIDIGCGCGDTTLELARRVGAGGRVVGADISAPMLAVAQGRAAAQGLSWAEFIQADAQTQALGAADGAFSRFGVMFFSDPAAAFANIRRALAPRGRLAFVCWRALAENLWMSTPMSAVAPLLPTSPAPPPPDAPGPFAFADRDRLHGLLRAGGFTDISIEPLTQKIGWVDLDTAVRTAQRIGPVGVATRENLHLKARIADAVRGALVPHAGKDGVTLDSATWIVRAT